MKNDEKQLKTTKTTKTTKNQQNLMEIKLNGKGYHLATVGFSPGVNG
jgi:hypothetical protein